jgi:hypothetical protein
MIGPAPIAASRAVRSALQQTLSCVTTDVLVMDVEAAITRLTLVSRLLRRGGQPVTLRFLYRFAVREDGSRPARERWFTRTVSYAYQLHHHDEREILAYHWHPDGRSHLTTPHLHMGAGAGSLIPELTTAHLPTGKVAPTAILALAIEQFGVRARRSDWAEVFASVETAIQDDWSTSPLLEWWAGERAPPHHRSAAA